MTFELFLNFNGDCCEAVAFYATVFKQSVENLTLFGDVPVDPNFPILPSDKNRIAYATVKIADKNIMFMDMSSDQPVTVGTNIAPVISTDNRDEVDRIFKELSTDGTVIMFPQKVYFNEYYAYVVDKFGINWHILLAE